MLVNKEANYHVKREKGAVMYPVKAAPVPTMMLHNKDSKEEIAKKNLSTMMSTDLDNILEINQHFPPPNKIVDTNKLKSK